jgi:hypothetical protein
MSAFPSTPISRLLKSWAIPPARIPGLSSFQCKPFPFVCLALSDIGAERHETIRRQRNRIEQYCASRTVFSANCTFSLKVSGFLEALECRPGICGPDPLNHLAGEHFQQLTSGISGHAARRFVQVDEPSRRISYEYRKRCIFNVRAVSDLTLMQSRCGNLVLSRVVPNQSLEFGVSFP